jgi:hypothetical protein
MAQEVQKLEDDISAALNDQTTLQKSQVRAKRGKTLAKHAPASPSRIDQREEEHSERDQRHPRQGK